MSLDVYLTGAEYDSECECHCGFKHAVKKRDTHYDANITHNLNKMAEEAGIYQALWRPGGVLISILGQFDTPKAG